jgi:hypothetical protein
MSSRGSLLSLSGPPYRAVKFLTASGGKVLNVSIGPLSVYTPTDEDYLTLQWSPSAFQELNLTGATNSSQFSINGMALPSFMIHVVSDRVFQNPQVTSVSKGGATAVGGGSVVGGASMAAAANRQALLANAANCPASLNDDPLDFGVHPLGFAIGTSIFRYHLGALLGNSVLAIGLLVVHFLAACVLKLLFSCSLLKALGHARFPARSLSLLTFLMQPTLTSATIVWAFSDDLQHSVACGFVYLGRF